MTEPTETKIIKEKKPRSEAQLLILAEARKKASAVRAENKLLREQEKEMARDLKTKEKQERIAKVKAHQESKKVKKVKEEELKPETDFMSESSDEEIVVMKKPKPQPKAKKKKVRVVYESDEELEEETPVPVRQTRVVSDTPPPMSPAQILQRKLYQQMFSM